MNSKNSESTQNWNVCCNIKFYFHCFTHQKNGKLWPEVSTSRLEIRGVPAVRELQQLLPQPPRLYLTVAAFRKPAEWWAQSWLQKIPSGNVSHPDWKGWLSLWYSSPWSWELDETDRQTDRQTDSWIMGVCDSQKWRTNFLFFAMNGGFIKLKAFWSWCSLFLVLQLKINLG